MAHNSGAGIAPRNNTGQQLNINQSPTNQSSTENGGSTAATGLKCGHCEAVFDSLPSLNVHNMHYHPLTANDPAVSGNNNNNSALSPPSITTDMMMTNSKADINQHGAMQSLKSNNNTNNNMQLIVNQKSLSPANMTNNNNNNNNMNSKNSNTIAAADSSDNQPSTPASNESQASGSQGQQQTPQQHPDYIGMHEYFHQDFHQLQQHVLGFDPLHFNNRPIMQNTINNHNNSNNSANSIANNNNLNMHQTQHHQQQQQQQQHLHHQQQQHISQNEYKAIVPSSRYPYPPSSPYNNNNNSGVGGGLRNLSTVTSTTSSTKNSNISPSQHQQLHSTAAMLHHSNLGQPTPSPSPNQCDKCGYICRTVDELHDHYATLHPGQMTADASRLRAGVPATGHSFTYPPPPSYGDSIVKDEPEPDLLDLDSKTVVYASQHNNNDPSLMNNNNIGAGGALPSIQSLQSLQVLRHSMWTHQELDPYGDQAPFMLQQHEQRIELERIKNFPSASPLIVKHEQHATKSEFLEGVGAKEIKSFDLHTGSPEFPSTTTPQDLPNAGTFRSFEPPTSSLSSVVSTKSTTWKSNEPRRPKTYNCTACNKWFTSSGHLKRHYNTTLHKNAVKISGRSDPSESPISNYHHPSRDPNSKHNRSNAAAAQQQQQQQAANNQPPPPPPPPDSQRDPAEYTPQYNAAGNGFNPQGFQQFNSSLSNASNSPNGQAGPSVQASQPRGLLSYSSNNNTGTVGHHQMQLQQQPLQQQVLVQPHHQPITNITNMDQQTTASSIINIIRNINHHPPTQEQQHQYITLNTHQSSSQHNTTTTIMSQPQQLIMDPASVVFTTTTSNPMGTLTMPPLPTSNTTINLHSMPHRSSQPEAIIQPQVSYPITIGNNHLDHQMEAESQATPIHFTDYSVNVGPGNFHIIQMCELDAHNTGDTILTFSSSDGSGHESFEMKEQQLMATDYLTSVYEDDQQLFAAAGSAAAQQPRHMKPMRALKSPKFGETAPEANFPSTPNVKAAEASTALATSTPQTIPTTARGGGGGKQQKKKTTSTSRARTADPASTRKRAVDPPDGAAAAAASSNWCELCQKFFNGSCYLTQHNNSCHGGERPFKCTKCGKKYASQDAMDVHFKRHLGEKPNKCDSCPKTFNHKTDLRRHMYKHKVENPYTCDRCDKGFVRKDHLASHKLNHKRRDNLKRVKEQQLLAKKAEKARSDTKMAADANKVTTDAAATPKTNPSNI